MYSNMCRNNLMIPLFSLTIFKLMKILTFSTTTTKSYFSFKLLIAILLMTKLKQMNFVKPV